MTKRADGRYQLSIMIGFNDNGTPKRKVVYGKTQKEVNAKASDLRVKHSMGLNIGCDITLGEWANVWLDTYKSGLEYNTKRMYADIVRIYIVKPLGCLKLKDVKTAHLQNIVNENSSKGRTVKLFKQTITQIFNQAIINDLVLKNPALGVKLPNIVVKNEKRALTVAESDAIPSLVLDLKTKCLVYLLMYTGMRKSEVLALSKSDIDWGANVIHVTKSLVFKVNKSDFKTTKTKASIRDIPILVPLAPILKDYLCSINSDLLFTCEDGSSLSDTAYRILFGKFVLAMGSTDITAHTFRHNFATILYNAGVDVKTAQYILGHTSITVTMDIYTKLDNRKKDEAASMLNAYVTNA